MELSVFNLKGEDTGRKVVLADEVFAIEPNDHAIYLAVKHYRANQRQGTHKSKERSEISGSTRKLIRQKGGGGARRGDINSPLLVGGARVFGPRPRNYSFKLNKKLLGLARRSALTYKAQEQQIIVVDALSMDKPRTKDFVQVTNALKVAEKKSLFILDKIEDNVYLSSRNIPSVRLVRAADLNTYTILDCNQVVMTEEAVRVVNEMCKA
ncbi:MAG: 50S ribosomal protein L4 [Porphyromonas sp.]|nr:50S ribosomal protein L4 [Porphyromonas sp.]